MSELNEISPAQAAPKLVHDGLPVPRRYWAIATIWLAMIMSVLDASIANVALPTIAREVGATPASSVWVVQGYQLATVMVLLPFAAIGDRIGYRRVYIAGLIVFTLGSLGCALSQSLDHLVISRAIQGLGAGGVMSINPALIRFTYPKAQLGRGLAYNVVVIAVSSAVAPSLSAAILAVGSWEWLFGVNVPIGVLVIAVAWRALPRTEGSGRPFDYLAAVLNAVAFGALILGAEMIVSKGPAAGLVLLAVSAVAFLLLVPRELKRHAPLVPVDLMRNATFAISSITATLSFAAQMLALLVLPFWLQGPLHRSVVETGLLLTPWPVGLALASTLAGRLGDRFHPGIMASAGLTVFAAGLMLVAGAPMDVANWDFAWRMFVVGVGFGIFQAPNNRALLGSAPVERSGAAGGVLAMGRVVGQAIGAVVVAMIFHLGGTHSSVISLWLGAGVGLAAAGISIMRLRTQPLL